MLRNLIAGFVVVLAVSSCGMTPPESSFPVRYVEQKPLYDAAAECESYSSLNVLDARNGNGSVGQRQFEDRPERVNPISMTGDLAAATAAGIRKGFDIAALRQNTASPISIQFDVVKLTLDERTKFNSVYNATLVVDVQVQDRRNQDAIWKARKTGHGENYGTPASTVNYQETVSRSIEDLVKALLKDAEFGRALCGTVGTGNPPVTPAPVGS